MVERALQLQGDLVEALVLALVVRLEQLVQGHVEAPRQIQLAAIRHREQAAVVAERQHGDAAPFRLQHGRHVALGHFGDVDSMQVDFRVEEHLLARLDHGVAGGDRENRLLGA